MKYYLNKNKENLDLYRKHLSKANKVDVAVSFIRTSGTQLLFESIKHIDPKDIRIVFTLDQFIIDPQLISRLLKKGYAVKHISELYDNKRSLHAKMINIYTKDGGYTIQGSQNITNKAFNSKYELVSLDKISDETIDYFEHL